MGHVKALPRVEPAGLSSTCVPQNMGVARFVEHPSAPLASSVKRERSPSSEDALATIEEAPKRVATAPDHGPEDADRDDAPPTTIWAEDDDLPRWVATQRIWAHMAPYLEQDSRVSGEGTLPSPRTGAAQALERMSLGSDQPKPRE